jgi:hypothetical protein
MESMRYVGDWLGIQPIVELTCGLGLIQTHLHINHKNRTQCGMWFDVSTCVSIHSLTYGLYA